MVEKKVGQSNINPAEVLYDIHRWVENAEANLLQVKSALITLKHYIEEVEKK